MSMDKSSLSMFRFKRTLDSLASKRGRHTELISLYVPPDRQISDVMNSLKQELGTASNIKSKSTRKNVLDAIERVTQRLKLFKKPPKNGLVIFCGAIPQNGAGSEQIETYVLTPPEPITLYYYRCDNKFHIEPLRDILKEKDTYGILVMDGNGATFATLKGRRLEIVQKITSGIPGKHRAGGQSARRFERLREAQVNEYYKRVGEHANNIFLKIPDLKGIIMGGPGPTKNDFESGDYLHYTIRSKILGMVDTAYVDEQGLKEVVEKSSEILQKVRYFEEKKLVQAFLYEIGHETGLATYGEEEVRRHLFNGSLRLLLLSEELDRVRAKIKCTNCGYVEEQTISSSEIQKKSDKVANKTCPKCGIQNLTIEDTEDIIDELAEIAEKTGTAVELISTRTEEGVELAKSFGGVAGILRFKPT